MHRPQPHLSNPTLNRDCAKARSPLAPRWAKHATLEWMRGHAACKPLDNSSGLFKAGEELSQS